eukprot:COSAG02_NODE_22479_length_751_cov_1.179448_1_plen_93_part_01
MKLGAQAVLLLTLGMAVVPRTATAQGVSVACTYDLTGDGMVTTDDLLWMLSVFGRQVYDSSYPSVEGRADGNGDGLVNTQDLLGLLAGFGRSC